MVGGSVVNNDGWMGWVDVLDPFCQYIFCVIFGALFVRYLFTVQSGPHAVKLRSNGSRSCPVQTADRTVWIVAGP